MLGGLFNPDMGKMFSLAETIVELANLSRAYGKRTGYFLYYSVGFHISPIAESDLGTKRRVGMNLSLAVAYSIWCRVTDGKT